MSLHRRAAKRDAVEADIIQALWACGWSVKQISQEGLPDLLLWKARLIRLAEVKTGGKPLRDSQQWWSKRGLPVAIFRTLEDVLVWNKQQSS